MATARGARHRRLSAVLASLGDADLAALVRPERAGGVGVGGGTAVVDVDGTPVFVKRIPLTDRELAHPGSTVTSATCAPTGSGSTSPTSAWRPRRASSSRPPSATSPNATPPTMPATPPCDWSTGW